MQKQKGSFSASIIPSLAMVRLRVVFSAAIMLGGIAVLAAPSGGAAAATGRAATAKPATDCVQVESVAITKAQDAAALKFWTRQRMDSAGQTFPSAAGGRAAGAAPAVSTECVTVPAGLTNAGAPVPPAHPSPAIPHGPFGGYVSVGKVFLTDPTTGQSTSCTASVIKGTRGSRQEASLILTAGHCVFHIEKGKLHYFSSITFAPDWYKGNAPFGEWTSSHIYYAKQWLSCTPSSKEVPCSENPNYDYAIVVLNPMATFDVGTITGENSYAVNQPATIKNVRLVGYPNYYVNSKTSGNGNKIPVSKQVPYTNTATATTSGCPSPGQPGPWRKASSPGFTGGTSGGPWFVHFNSTDELGTLIGSVGGCDQGGPTNTPSYSAVWNDVFTGVVKGASNAKLDSLATST